MTNEELKQRFRKLMATNQPLNEITTLFNQALDCPELKIKEDNGNDYRLAKIIWHAMLLEMAEQCCPYSESSMELSGKLQEYYRKKAGRVK
ncbi:MAG: hypothetical protein EOP41_07035 [Sphingobacteriaceae bacterium]|nr:MAG: hypothetical protein EOP41_07035 [Sphingobacteriaceae bacterium]